MFLSLICATSVVSWFLSEREEPWLRGGMFVFVGIKGKGERGKHILSFIKFVYLVNWLTVMTGLWIQRDKVTTF